jgi:DNA-directed RNA polymerase specialized sigma24 family protein
LSYDPSNANGAHADPVWAYIRAITVNQFHYHLRKEARRKGRCIQRLDLTQLIDPGANGHAGQHVASGWLTARSESPFDTLADNDVHDWRMAILRRMHRLLPEIVQMRGDGFAHEEIAEVLETSVRTKASGERLFAKQSESGPTRALRRCRRM